MQINPHFAEQLALTEREYATAQVAYADAQTQLHALQRRRAALESERQQIIAERAAGNFDEEQEARLAVIAADIEGLNPLIETAEMEVTELEPTRLREQRDYARAQWESHQAMLRFEALDSRVREIESLFMSAVAELCDAGKAVGKRYAKECYKPHPDLHKLIVYGALPVNHVWPAAATTVA